MTKNTKLYSNTADITKAITSIKNRGGKLDADIQLAGLSILQHIEQHGDTTLADKLYDAMPKGARRLALAEWMLAFGMIRALKKQDAADKEAIAAGRSFSIDRTKKTDMPGATAMQWHEFKPEKHVTEEAFDVQAEVQKLLGRIQKAQASGRAIVHPEVAERLAVLTGSVSPVSPALPADAPL
jgi:hypothetical protein